MKCDWCGIEQEDIMEEGQFKNGFCCIDFENEYNHINHRYFNEGQKFN